MRRGSRLRVVCVLAAGLTVLAAFGASVAQPPERPRLLVMLIFDQMRGDYLVRWNDLFTENGFRRLEREGTLFTNCHYPYANTITGPGHASLGTGASPDRHGIIANDWYDRKLSASVYCASLDRYRTVLSDPAAVRKERASGSPERMLVPTFAEALKEATGGKAKVVSVAHKDRSAILPGGRRADACYWFDDQTGTFCTSTYYRDRPHAWVNEYNQTRPADRWFGRTWDRLRGDVDYVRHSGPDDVASEGTGVARRQGRVFPHPMNAGLDKPGKNYFDTLETSPFGNELMLDFALRAVDAEGLGQDDVPDFLNIGFSSNDLVGHQYGPDSQEVLDTTLRSDLIVRDLLEALDRKVGKGRYVVTVSADHGICPIPEVAASQGKDAVRINPTRIAADATKFLNDTYGAAGAPYIEHQSLPWYYLNHKLLAARGLQPADVAEALAGHLRKHPSVLAVYTRRQLEAGIPPDDVIGQKVRKSFHPDRCGDLAYVAKPYHQVTTYTTGTTHGSPHAYDTHVPLVVFGPGVPAGRSEEAVTPQAIVAALAWAAGIAPPSGCEAPVPERLSRK